ncbi:MAG: winged helix-turn-helix domain-containing protein [Candidatus Hermodarchaeota archaeon]
MDTPKNLESIRKELEIISEKTRYKILLTLLASEESLSFSELKELLPSIPENNLIYHLNKLKEKGFIKNEKRMGYKRSEPRSFYSLSNKTFELFESLGLTAVKEEFRALFKQMT